MDTVKVFANGQSQAVRLPKKYRFASDEVGIQKVGEVVLLFPKDNAWAGFLASPPASDDFGDAILAARREDGLPARETL
ncbi:MAG: type II toxin-antitoxin system VapB family antitoxin [Clostridiales bacterium]|nr:type II toxin-antitoxin system VapB family antitoxin [Clostridiales bacterium]